MEFTDMLVCYEKSTNNMEFISFSDEYPFTGRTEVRFGNSSQDFTMTTRLKRVNDSTDDSCSKTVFGPTKQVQLQVRCLRAPSRCAMSFKCTRATNWFWWLFDPKHHFGPQSNAQWIDSSVQLIISILFPTKINYSNSLVLLS